MVQYEEPRVASSIPGKRRMSDLKRFPRNDKEFRKSSFSKPFQEMGEHRARAHAHAAKIGQRAGTGV
jgi:hypothetical protein